MTQPLVSIIIPLYNYGNYLKEAVTSALQQTYNHIEILIVDDKSTDNSLEIARELEDKHENITVFARQHTGRSETTNFGTGKAKGDYILKLDADDKLHPDFVSELVSTLESNPNVSFAYTHAQMFGTENSKVFCQKFNAKKLYYSSGFFATSLFRRKVFDMLGGYDEDMETAEDWDLYLRCIENDMKGMLVPKFLLYYRSHCKKRKLLKVTNALSTYCHIINKHWKSYSLFIASSLLSIAFVNWFLGEFWHSAHDSFREKMYNNGIGVLYYRRKHS